MKRIFAVLIIAMSSFSASADWVAVGFEGGNVSKPMVAIDYSSSFVVNGIKVTWWKEYFRDLTSVQRPGNHPMHVYRTQIDCKMRMIKNEYVQSYEAKHFYDPNPSIYEDSWNGPGIWVVPTIGSSAEFVTKLVCNLK